jgi:DNA-binding beta-propeller fold protein YncE
MRTNRAASALALVVAATIALASAVDARPAKATQRTIVDPIDQSLLGAAPVYDTTCVYWEDFLFGDGGWVPADVLAGPAYWHQDTYNSAGVAWCGSADSLLLATPPGYGNSWNQYLTKPFVLPAGSPAISYRIQYDAEQDCDFLYLDVSTDGGATYTALSSWTGNSGGFVNGSISLSAYAGSSVVIRFRFQSDGGWSDEDGIYDSDGGARIDSVKVANLPADYFESGLDGWTPSVKTCGYSYRFVEIPECEADLPCDDICFSWVAYDSVTGDFPFETADNEIDIAIESPVITVPSDATRIILTFDVYRNLPFGNYLFYSWSVAGPPSGDGGGWYNSALLYYGTDGMATHTVDLTPYIAAGATQIKVRLRGIDGCQEFGGGTCLTHNCGPVFDNIAVHAVNTITTGIDDSEFPRACGEDADGDGALGGDDQCATVNASNFDSDGDGCIDDAAGARHVEYWSRDAFPVKYYIDSYGAGFPSGTEFEAIQAGMATWTTVPDVDAALTYAGTKGQPNAAALDRVNLVTFRDPDFHFAAGTIAVGTTTTLTEPGFYWGRWYRPGQIIDSDIILNPAMKFRTAEEGPPDGVYIEAVTAHEAGHFFGLSHTPTRSSTMYFVLPAGLEAASLAAEDSMAMFAAYATAGAMATASRLSGAVTSGYGSGPVAGAAVFAISAVSGDTLACEYTLPDGSYTFAGLPDGDYYVSIHALDGTSSVGFLLPAYVSDFVASTAATLFVPESWDSSESATDNAAERDPVSVSATGPDAVADIVTNRDEVPPMVTMTRPVDDATGVPIDAAVLVAFSEAIDDSTLRGDFSITDTTTHAFISGNASILNDDSLVAFVPGTSLEFASTYEIMVGTGLRDKFGNALADTFRAYFTTEVEPDVALTSLSPSKGVVGMIVSLNGKGFDPVPANNTVRFNGVEATVSQATLSQLVVTVPTGAASGALNVYNQTQGKTSNSLQFTVLPSDDVPRGFGSGSCVLSALPRALTLLKDGSYAFVATDQGVDAVVADPGQGGYMTADAIPIQGGLTGIAAGPASNRVYGVSSTTGQIYRIDATPGSMGVLSEKAIGATPRGILVSPRGHRAYIPTDDGEIQIWDIDETSLTFESQVGVIVPPDLNVRGELAIDPAGDRLLAITGTGRVLVIDLDSNSVAAMIDVGPAPRDISFDPVSGYAYVCDETGTVSIVSPADSACMWAVRTGGALRGISVTPAGAFALVVNRLLNLLEAVDLRQASSTFLSVVATVELPVNPVGLELSPDGRYAFTISEAEERLVATNVGLGPSLASLSLSAGPVGTRLVLAGRDFASGTSTQVAFNQAMATPERLADSSLTVAIPPGATSGGVCVVVTNGEQEARSNALYFDVLGASGNDLLRPAAILPGVPSPAMDGGSVLSAYPSGDYMALSDRSGNLHVLVSDGASAQCHRYLGSVQVGSAAADIVITPDGARAFAVLPDSGDVVVVAADPLRPDFLSILATIDFSGITGSEIAAGAASPDGSLLLVSDSGTGQVHLVDLVPGSPNQYDIVASVALSGGNLNGVVRQMAFHPGGAYAYLPVHDSDPAAILVLDTAPESPTYAQIVATAGLPGSPPQEMPISLAFTPDGGRCLVLTSQQVTSPARSAVMLNTVNPASPWVSRTLGLVGSVTAPEEHMDVSPRGDRAIANICEAGLVNIRVWISPDSLAVIQQTGSPSHHQSTVDSDYLPDGSKFYSLSEASDSLTVYDFSAAYRLTLTSGSGQSGVVGQPLAAPLAVRVTSASSDPVAGVPVTFKVVSGGGRFAAADSAVQVVPTDSDGYAEAIWTLGAMPGSQEAEAVALGLVGSPAAFTATGVSDPEALPLTVAGIKPASGQTGVGLATSVQVSFSRAVNPETVTPSTFYMLDGNFRRVPVAVGFSQGNRCVSLSLPEALEPLTVHSIHIGTGIRDESDGALTEPVTSTFTTGPAPALSLVSLAPVSGPIGAPIVLSGAGFNKADSLNKVLFNGLSAFVSGCGAGFVTAVVPDGAETGPVRVVNMGPVPPDTSNSLSFSVLAREGSPIDNVVSTISTGSATHGVSITPDGAFAYAVSPDGNRVNVIDLNTLMYVTSIPVGYNPVAITIEPKGVHAYVANYVDGTVSVIDLDSVSETYNEVVDVFPVGIGPSDLVITPDGHRLIVANAASGNLSVVDADQTSETYRSVVASIATGSGSRTVAITPDGGLLYVGTDSGYMVIATLDYGVVASISTGTGSRTISITPDGGLLVILTTEGVVNLIDIRVGSPFENQVVASIRTGSGTSSVAITPDGGMLYLIQEVGDVIYAGVINIYNTHGVVTERYELPATRVEVTLVDTLRAGEDPAEIAFDPAGTGRFVVTNAGDNTMTYFVPCAGVLNQPDVQSVFQNSPNPFHQTTTIRFSVSEPARVRVAVYDVRGRLLRMLVDKDLLPDVYSVGWNGTDRTNRRVASGIYFCRIDAGNFTRTTKLLMLK